MRIRRPELPMAHILPHWTWPERVGLVTPVHVFTSGDEAELKRALEIDANSATAYLFLALLKSAQGDLDEGTKKIKRAEKLDPYSPTIISFAVGIYGAAGRFDDGIAAGKRMVQLDPSYIYFEPALAEAYRAKGRLACSRRNL